ncbi:MAG: FAD-binding protein [Flavobacteriales bacterium]|nr:FAD-binding protein [Flavobacteriales bacterium]
MQNELIKLGESIKGDIFLDEFQKIIYSTDASAYREKPIAITRPKDKSDLQIIIDFAIKHNVNLIPRAAGTSLAGQVVGNGIIVDISKHFNEIIEINPEEKYAIVEPGVVRDELNIAVKKYGLFFAPETSTANRCMIGGMHGNNSCGANALIHGSVREHVISSEVILSDGSEVEFKDLTKEEFDEKLKGNTLESKLYTNIFNTLCSEENIIEIEREFPDKAINRRNTGYAIDMLIDNQVFSDSKKLFNFNQLLAGSEGTLAFTTKIKVNLVDLPPAHTGLVCVHIDSVVESAKANLIALKLKPNAVELMDNIIINLTKDNITQSKNRFFIQGDPGALLIVEFSKDSKEELEQVAKKLEADLRAQGLGYHFPLLVGDDVKKVWDLRKAGLGVLGNMPGDAKPAPVVEDTTVKPEDLPAYLEDVQVILDKRKLESVYYAHISTGEIHIRPVLNLKTVEGRDMFKTIALDFAELVKKYRGSLSGEHGDGRLRGEFIPFMIGKKNYALLEELKKTWDPNGIFNRDKIVNTPSMNTFLRYDESYKKQDIKTVFDFSKTEGFQKAVEKCNGSGDCRKSHIIGGTMCPSYQASKNESQTTRARANILREYMSHSDKENPLDHKEIYDVMDLCLSCKACKSECPSNVDITKLKAEFLQHYYDDHGVPMRTRMIAYNPAINKLISPISAISNFVLDFPVIGGMITSMIGFTPKRKVPHVHSATVTKYHKKLSQNAGTKGKVYLFNDEFTNYNDPDVGIYAIRLFNALGYEVVIPKHRDSARTFLSKGMIREAKNYAVDNVLLLKDLVSEETPLIGVEPSAILGFRDEYPELVGKDLQAEARELGKNALLFEEWFMREVKKGNISKDSFTELEKMTKLHGHCHQKAVASTQNTLEMLNFPMNYRAEEIPSGCCGMAGSFGYEKEHYDLSMAIGELVLFPAVREAAAEVEIAAPGTSCRHQIKDGTGEVANHPIAIMYNALK